MLIVCVYLIIGCLFSMFITSNDPKFLDEYRGFARLMGMMFLIIITPILLPGAIVRNFKKRGPGNGQ